MSILGVGENDLVLGTTMLSPLTTAHAQAALPQKRGFLSAARLMHNAISFERSHGLPTITSTKDLVPSNERKDLVRASAAGSIGDTSENRRKPPKSAEFIVDSDDSDAARHEETNIRAPARRRSWTPVKDDVPQQTSPSIVCTKNFANLVNGFHYGDCGAEQEKHDAPEPVVVIAKKHPPKRSSNKKSASDKSAKKATKPVREPKTKKVAARPPREPKSKKGKSKVQTITALAIAPYRSPEKVHSPQPTIPEALAAVAQPPADPGEAKQPAIRKRKAPTSDRTKVKKPKRGVTKSVRATIKDLPYRDLLAPVQARNSLDNQVFIFGTSSQLHAEESPETLTRIQQALHESELSPRSNVSPIYKSRHWVPTAPHGTSLSAGQAHRDLWCVSARDDAGGTLSVNDHHQDLSLSTLHETGIMEKINDEEKLFLSVAESADMEDDLPLLRGYDSRIADASREGALHPPPVDATQVQPGPAGEDDFVALSSDPLPVSPEPAVFTRPRFSPLRLPPGPSSQRGVLQPLDANSSMRSPLRGTASVQQFRLSSGKAPSVELAPSQPRRRRSNATKNEQEVVVISSSSPAVVVERHAQVLNITSPSKILASIHSSPPSDWHDVDEISDSEEAPTPSPPRRQNKLPQQDVSLDFDADEAVDEAAGVISAAPTTSKDDPQWSSAFLTLFPRITSSIKAMERSDSLTNPNWHEKILLYDPIVIEDLTAWLNSQGLRVTIRRTRSRKKKGVLEPEHDETQEELSHWMVQKWCEENSVCCLWREGLRGGVRTRY